MNYWIASHSKLTDTELLAEVERLAATERSATVHLIAALAEVDSRRLYLGQGCSSLFVFCKRVLHLSEHAAYDRITAARTARRFPVVLDMLGAGDLTLTSLTLLAPHLDEENCNELLARARQRTKRELQVSIAAFHPCGELNAAIRQLPPANPATDAPDRVLPLTPTRHLLTVAISSDARERLEKARALLSHHHSPELGALIERAIALLLREAERSRLGGEGRGRRRVSHSTTRHIPSSVRRAVWARDGGRCAFHASGRRCDETSFLEFHHVVPFEAGGAATEKNIQLRCRAHNQYEADLFNGEPFIVRERRLDYLTDSVRTELR